MINPRTSKVSKTRGTSPSRRVLHSTILREYSGVRALITRLTLQRDLWKGESERILGKLIAEATPEVRKELYIATKCE
jgi:hypothetical protein